MGLGVLLTPSGPLLQQNKDRTAFMMDMSREQGSLHRQGKQDTCQSRPGWSVPPSRH